MKGIYSRLYQLQYQAPSARVGPVVTSGAPDTSRP